MEQRLMTGRLHIALIPMAFVLIMTGCAHTLPSRTSNVKPPHSLTVGIKSFYDVNGFDYSGEVKSALAGDSRFNSIILTPDLNDPQCDYVIKGSFCHYRVGTCTGFYYASIYFLWIPAFTGIPTSRFDGSMTAEVEVYRKGNLLKTLSYEDVFSAARSYLTLFPSGVSLEAELDRVANNLKADVLDITKPEAFR